MATEESKRFAIETIQRAREYAEDFTLRVYGDAPRPLQGEALISLLRTNMWREYMLGVQGPAKLMTLIGNIEHIDVRYLLGTQMVDEMRHSDTFSARVKALGGDGELSHYEPTPEDIKLVEATLGFDDPAELVTSLNCTGEVILQQTFMRITERKLGSAIVDDETADLMEREILYDEPDGEDDVIPLVDRETAEALRKDVIPDEGRHVKIGRLVLQEYALTDEIQARCREVQDLKFKALDLSHGRTMRDAKALSQTHA
jgi:hypothetical protein